MLGLEILQAIAIINLCSPGKCLMGALFQLNLAEDFQNKYAVFMKLHITPVKVPQ